MNPDPFQHWHRVKNVAKVKINGKSCKAFLDNGAQINTITPTYVKNHSVEMGPIIDLIGARVSCVGLEHAYTLPLGYVIVWVQVDRVKCFDEDQIALIVLDESKFAEQIPIILGTLIISYIVNVMKEREIDALVMPWANTRVAHLLSMHRAAATVVDDQTLESAYSNGYDEVVFTRNMETIEASSSCVISIKMEKAYMGECINIMTQVLKAEDDSLPQGLHCPKCIQRVAER